MVQHDQRTGFTAPGDPFEIASDQAVPGDVLRVGVRGVEEYEIEPPAVGGCHRPPPCVPDDDTRLRSHGKSFEVGLQSIESFAVAFVHPARLRPARQRLQPQRPAAGEDVRDAQSGQLAGGVIVHPQNLEDRLLDPVGYRTRLERRWPLEPPRPPFAPDDSH